jgi:hypothetical protein
MVPLTRAEEAGKKGQYRLLVKKYRQVLVQPLVVPSPLFWPNAESFGVLEEDSFPCFALLRSWAYHLSKEPKVRGQREKTNHQHVSTLSWLGDNYRNGPTRTLSRVGVKELIWNRLQCITTTLIFGKNSVWFFKKIFWFKKNIDLN